MNSSRRDERLDGLRVRARIMSSSFSATGKFLAYAAVSIVAVAALSAMPEDALARARAGGYARAWTPGSCLRVSATTEPGYASDRLPGARLRIRDPEVCLDYQRPPGPAGSGGPGRPGPRGPDRFGQPEGAGPGERALRAVDAVRMKWLMRELRVDEKKGEIIRNTYEKGLERRRELLQERLHLLAQMREIGLRPEAPGVPNAERDTREAVQRFREVEREIATAGWETEQEILDQLAPAQRLRYVLFNERFERQLRDRIRALKQR
ncbi:MAG: hypothetical protein V2A71_11375 [Candidatus Eisenbacteria bacterium]